MKKLTIEYIRTEFEKEGYKLLSEEYKNSKDKFDLICPNGHKYSTKWNVWQQGHRCPICAVGNAKLTYEFVKESFEQEGYSLLSREYINSLHKLDYRCSKGHDHHIKWSGWKSGNRCPTCACVAKPTLKQIRESFEKEEYTLLSNEYKNNYTKLNYICSKGHKHSVGWNSWKTGYRCPHCSTNAKLTIDHVKESFEKEGCALLSKDYNNSNTKLDYICSNGHKHSIVWGSWQQGHKCSICANINNSGSGNPRWLGGISYEPYCPIWKDKEYKEDIKIRDGYICLNPDCWRQDDRLHVHHIDYDKKNCSPHNLITVCRSCNARANTDREWYTAWYKAILYRRYAYE